MLLSRNYSKNIINAAIARAVAIPRSEALKRVVREKSQDRPVFVITYDPRLPSIVKIVHKHYRTMIKKDPRMKTVFPAPPLIAYRRPPTLREKLIRAKLAEKTSRPTRPKRKLTGIKPCNKPCQACPFVETTKTVKSTATNIIANINTAVTCTTSWVIYLITCNKRGCGLQYVGKTEQDLASRLGQHKNAILNKNFEYATAVHFCSRGHELFDMTIAVIEKIYTTDRLFIEEREKDWIRIFNTFHKGMNRTC